MYGGSFIGPLHAPKTSIEPINPHAQIKGSGSTDLCILESIKYVAGGIGLSHAGPAEWQGIECHLGLGNQRRRWVRERLTE